MAKRSWSRAAILDYLDELAGPERALLPRVGAERRQALNLMAMATGAAEKACCRSTSGVFRPEDEAPPALGRPLPATQMSASLAAIDRYLGERGVSQWLVGKRMTQADITAVCAFTFLNDTLRVAGGRGHVPVAGHAGRALRVDAGLPGNARAVLSSRNSCERSTLMDDAASEAFPVSSALKSADAGQLAADRELVDGLRCLRR